MENAMIDECMDNGDKDKIIVSLTSWAKRIAKINVTIDSILSQTRLPDSIELNLSEEEFPNREKDFPTKIREYLSEHSNIVKCNWVYKNTRTFKKIIPTIEKYKNCDEYLLLSIDDDVLYRSDYIDMMVKYIKKYNSDSFCLSNSRVIGNKMIYKSTCFNDDFVNCLTDEVISFGIDDKYTQHYLECKGKKMANYKPDNLCEIVTVHDEIFPLHDEYRKNNRIERAYAAINKIKFN